MPLSPLVLLPLVAVFAPPRPLSPPFGQSWLLESRRYDPNEIGEVCQFQSNHTRSRLVGCTVSRPHPRHPCTGRATPRDQAPSRGDRRGAPPPWRLRGRASLPHGATTSHINIRARAPGGAGGRFDARRARPMRTASEHDPAPLAARRRLLDGQRSANSTECGAAAGRKEASSWAAPQPPSRGFLWRGHAFVLTGSPHSGGVPEPHCRRSTPGAGEAMCIANVLHTLRAQRQALGRLPAYLVLAITIVLEVFATTCMKMVRSHGPLRTLRTASPSAPSHPPHSLYPLSAPAPPSDRPPRAAVCGTFGSCSDTPAASPSSRCACCAYAARMPQRVRGRLVLPPSPPA